MYVKYCDLMPSCQCAVTGLCGGSASGKTTVARKIIEALDVPWVVLLSMDSFYKVCVCFCTIQYVLMVCVHLHADTHLYANVVKRGEDTRCLLLKI